MIEDIARLHNWGIALIPLKPKSKKPLEAGWTKGPRHDWPTLKALVIGGRNVGARLGSASKFPDETHLAAIDCDVKSKDPKDLKEMELKLAVLIPVPGPVVLSGRGNGSKHVYVRTRVPASPKLFARSSNYVKVHMPSVGPNKTEIRKLLSKEVENGIRLRPAWEISIMGEGQQVVLPPSVHPDSGKEYTWQKPIESWEEIPIFDSKLIEEVAKKESSQQNFTTVPVDIFKSPLDNETVDKIVDGKGSGDRSADLLGVTTKMLNCGFTDEQILTVLTDDENYLGCVPYEHTKSRSRQKAVNWLRRYVLAKAKGENSETTFDKIEEDESTSEERRGWTARLDRTDNGKVRGTHKNIKLILENEIGGNVFRQDLFSRKHLYGLVGPWNGAKVGDDIRDQDIGDIMFWLAEKWRLESNENKVHAAIKHIAGKNGFHPVRDYLNSLKWDKTPRINTWLKDYLGAEGPEPYLSDVSKKVLCAMVARVTTPGCKFDYMLILEGLQGQRKSMALRALASPWFSDAKLDPSDKDGVLNIQGTWIFEVGELGFMRISEVNLVKAFITRQSDRIRVPYGRIAEEFPRQCILVGTTNSDHYLKDETGNRRFWPVKIKKCDVERIEQDRDQLLAEAKIVFDLGEPLYLQNQDSANQAEIEQSKRRESDEWIERIEEILLDETGIFPKSEFTTLEMLGAILADDNPFNQKRMGRCLKDLGFARRRARRNGKLRHIWTREKDGD